MTTPSSELTDGIGPRTPGWVRAWNRFWFAPADPTGLALMRVLAGLLVFYVLLVYSYDLFSYLGPHPWMDTAAQNYVRKESPVIFPEDSWLGVNHTVEGVKGEYFWSIFYHVQNPAAVITIHVAILVILLLFTAGVWTRVTSVLAWLGALQYVNRLPTSMFGQDTMLIILLLYLMIGNSGGALSVDRWLEARRRRREGQPDPGPRPSWSANLALRLVQVHFCFIYMTSGLTKLLGGSWWNGTALWFCMANYNFAPMRVPVYYWGLDLLCQNMWVWQLAMSGMAVFTLFTEIGFTFLVWRPRWRPVMVTCSVLMHLGIGFIMSLVVFSMLMMTMVIAFVPPEQIRAWVDGWGDRLRRRFKAKEPPAARPAPAREAPVLART